MSEFQPNNGFTKERFLNDVKDHELTIELEAPVHRSIYLARPGSVYFSFRLVTFPDHLSFTGDMGAFTFRRNHDMFAFFRRDPDRSEKEVSDHVHPGYWSEKVVAAERLGCDFGISQFKPELFYQYLEEEREEIRAEVGNDEDWERLMEIEQDGMGVDVDPDSALSGHFYQLAKLNEARDLFDGETEDSACRAVMDAEVTVEPEFREFTYRYLWCCHALVWAIDQYDAAQRELGNGVFNQTEGTS